MKFFKDFTDIGLPESCNAGFWTPDWDEILEKAMKFEGLKIGIMKIVTSKVLESATADLDIVKTNLLTIHLNHRELTSRELLACDT